MRIASFRFTFLTVAAAFLAGCTSAPRYTTNRTTATASQVTIGDRSVRVGGEDIVKKAECYMGTPYRMGGTTSRGIDCSGLVYAVYKQYGIALPRTSSDQARFGARVGKSQLRPGDLVFFRTTGGSRVSHVGIYSGNGQFIHASTRSKRVRYDRMDNKYFTKRFATARRVL